MAVAAGESDSGAGSEGCRVLVVDDEEVVRGFPRGRLEEEGHLVLEAHH